jgi:hypothetical protein
VGVPWCHLWGGCSRGVGMKEKASMIIGQRDPRAATKTVWKGKGADGVTRSPRWTRKPDWLPLLTPGCQCANPHGKQSLDYCFRQIGGFAAVPAFHLMYSSEYRSSPILRCPPVERVLSKDAWPEGCWSLHQSITGDQAWRCLKFFALAWAQRVLNLLKTKLYFSVKTALMHQSTV